MGDLKISLLGPPQITLDGVVVEMSRHKAVGLLAFLVTEPKSHHREALAALFWPDYPQASAFSYLRRTLWELNHMLGKGWVESDRENVTLAQLPNIEVDIRAFQHHLVQDENQTDALIRAVSLYRGDFMEGFVIADTAPFENWQTNKVEYFRREFVQNLEKLVDIYENDAAYERALPYARRWLTLDRLNEAAYRAVMRQLAGMGNRSEVVRVHQACVQILNDELGIPPQEETEQVYQAILRGERPDRHAEKIAPPLAGGQIREPGNLPSPTTPFVGRQDEIEIVRNLVLNPDVHLLTLTGPGGTGKTRLSIQVAAEMDGNFPDGTWFIPLAPVQSPLALVMTVVKHLDYSCFTGEESARQQLLDYLRQKKMLIILDNFEHLLNGGRELMAEILETAQDIKLLVTSRERLNLRAEQVYIVQGLPIPDQRAAAEWDHPEKEAITSSALQLLLERARRVRPDFQLTRENLDAAIHICELLEGSPLGIELAVAWLELLPIEEIDQEITHSLDFLESNSADAPARQHSLRAVFETSWRLLDAQEKQTFLRLCVFQGSFSRQAAQQVSGATMQVLLSLANKSWLQQSENARFQLHEMLRQYGIQYLQSDKKGWQETKDRHAEFFSAFMQVQGCELQTVNQIQALQGIKTELESNIPAAWEWLVSMGRFDEIIEKILPGLYHYWLIRSGSEDFIAMLKHARKAVPVTNDHKTLLQRAILETVETNFELVWAILDDQPKDRMKQVWMMVKEFNLKDEMGLWFSTLITTYGNFVNFEEGLQYSGFILNKIDSIQNPWDLGYSYVLAAYLCDAEDIETKKKYISNALAVFKKIGVVHEQGYAMYLLGQLAAKEFDYELAISHTQSAIRYLEQAGDLWGVNQAWMGLADYFIFSGDTDQAYHAFDVTRRFTENVGNRRILGINLSWESLATSRYGDLKRALELRKRSLEIAIEVGNQSDIAWHTWEMGEVYRLLGDVRQAERYYRDAYPMLEKWQGSFGCGFYHRGMGDIAIMLSNWAQAKDEFEQALELQAKETGNVTSWASIYYHSRLGTILLKLGNLGEARRHLKIALSLAESWHSPDVKALPMVGIAALLAETGSPNEAIEIAACVAKMSTTWNDVKRQAKLIIDQASEALSPKQARLSKERGVCQDINQLVTNNLNSPHLALETSVDRHIQGMKN